METQSLDRRKILVTGGLGFVGSNLARRLVGLGADVTVVDNLFPTLGGSYANVRGIEDHLHIAICDLAETARLPQLVTDVDYIFNLAGQTSHLGSMEEPITDAKLNCLAQLALLEACRLNNPSCKLVFASTRQVYGRPDYLPVDELHPVRPVDINGVHKIACENYHLLYHRLYGIRCAILRLTNTYGPRMRVKDASQIFLGLWVRLALQGQPFEVWGGQQLRDFTYVDDVVEALLAAALTPQTDGEVFNLSGSAVISLVDLANMLSAASGGTFVKSEFAAKRERIDIGDYYADDRRFRSLTGWAPKVDLSEGLRRTLEYYRENLVLYL